MKVFSFDIESVGLRGPGFCVGYAVWDNGVEEASGLLGTEVGYVTGLNRWRPSGVATEKPCFTDEDQRWISRNVVPHLPVLGRTDLVEVRAQFWDLWTMYRRRGAVMLVNTPFPVESNFLAACVADDPSRLVIGTPLPIIDLKSLILASGKLGETEEWWPVLPNEKPEHNPVCDARRAARIFFELRRSR